ncbi:MAG: FmdB family transcriptional regulator [Chloroflexi bacterium]|nr:FmdB family transcriptional regulator [Chloroflexota bacterium]
MPTYDYQCRSCGSVTEVIHSMLEDGPSVCERCGGVLRRVLFPAGIIFKGSGFYRNDSRNGDPARSADGGSSQSTDADKSATPSGSISKAPAKAAEPKASTASEAEAPTG